jgi:hypothetical protein
LNTSLFGEAERDLTRTEPINLRLWVLQGAAMQAPEAKGLSPCQDAKSHQEKAMAIPLSWREKAQTQ